MRVGIRTKALLRFRISTGVGYLGCVVPVSRLSQSAMIVVVDVLARPSGAITAQRRLQRSPVVSPKIGALAVASSRIAAGSFAAMDAQWVGAVGAVGAGCNPPARSARWHPGKPKKLAGSARACSACSALIGQPRLCIGGPCIHAYRRSLQVPSTPSRPFSLRPPTTRHAAKKTPF